MTTITLKQIRPKHQTQKSIACTRTPSPPTNHTQNKEKVERCNCLAIYIHSVSISHNVSDWDSENHSNQAMNNDSVPANHQSSSESLIIMPSCVKGIVKDTIFELYSSKLCLHLSLTDICCELHLHNLGCSSLAAEPRVDAEPGKLPRRWVGLARGHRQRRLSQVMRLGEPSVSVTSVRTVSIPRTRAFVLVQ